MSTSLRGRLARENARWWLLQCGFQLSRLNNPLRFPEVSTQRPPHPSPLGEKLSFWFNRNDLKSTFKLSVHNCWTAKHCSLEVDPEDHIWAWLWLFANSNTKTSPKQMKGLYFRSSGFKAQTRCLITTNLLKTYFGIHCVAIQMERI